MPSLAVIEQALRDAATFALRTASGERGAVADRAHADCNRLDAQADIVEQLRQVDLDEARCLNRPSTAGNLA